MKRNSVNQNRKSVLIKVAGQRLKRWRKKFVLVVIQQLFRDQVKFGFGFGLGADTDLNLLSFTVSKHHYLSVFGWNCYARWLEVTENGDGRPQPFPLIIMASACVRTRQWWLNFPRTASDYTEKQRENNIMQSWASGNTAGWLVAVH